MRALRHLIPQDLQDRLNASPVFRWLVLVLMIVAGGFLLHKGIVGVRDRRVTGKRGQVYEGLVAQVLGVIYAILGAVIIVLAIGSLLAL